jgi:hypothetical protein
MRKSHTILLSLLLALAAGPLYAGQLSAAHDGPILMRAGSALVRFKLVNNSNAPVPLSLSFSPASDLTSGMLVQAPKAEFTLEAGNAALPKQIDAGEPLNIVARMSDFTGSSLAAVRLYNGSAELGEWPVVALDDPLDLTLAGDGAPEKPLQLVWGREARLSLKNDSANFLPFDWTFNVNGGPAVNHGSVRLAPGTMTRIVVDPPLSAFSAADFIRAAPYSGELVLRMQVPSGVSPDLAPQRSLAVALQMSGLNPFWIAVSSYIYVTIFLVIGGLLSVLASTVLPNYLKKLDYWKHVTDLASRTSSVSTRVDSYLRVLLRLERKKIDVLLKGVHAFSFSASEDFSDIAIAVDSLQKRLEVAERLDDLRRQFESHCSTAPPSISDNIDRAINAAASQLHPFVLHDADVSAANTFLDKAESLLNGLSDNDTESRTIAANFIELQNRVSQFPAAFYADLKAALPGVFEILSHPFDDARNIAPEMFFAIDHGIAAIHALLNYAMVRASIPQAGSTNCVHPGQGLFQRLKDRECRLIEMLGTLSWQSLQAAINLVQQMREDIYEEDVLRELTSSRAHIIFDTQRARPYRPVFFSISFDDSRFNGAAAIENILVCWTFPNELKEQGWKVCHYFQGDEGTMVLGGARKVDIECEFFDSTGQQQSRCSTGIKVQAAFRHHEYSRARAELLRFLIAFGIALASLESGGLDQLAKLGFIQATIAIIALGFGADAIKNLLSQSAKAPPPAPPKST